MFSGREFLSTPSARRATPAGKTETVHDKISIHALREEGDSATTSSQQAARISIHALREEGDAVCAVCAVIVDKISIHALREEGDGSAAQGCPQG